jgi:hypothetical protein
MAFSEGRESPEFYSALIHIVKSLESLAEAEAQ